MDSSRIQVRGWRCQDITSDIQQEIEVPAFRTSSFTLPCSSETPGSAFYTFSQDDNTPSSSSSSKPRKDGPHVPRPPNPFILFRADYSKANSRSNGGPLVYDTTLSKRASIQWKMLPLEEKKKYQKMAERIREDHATKYPHYRFRPKKRKSQNNIPNRYPGRCPVVRRPQAAGASTADASEEGPVASTSHHVESHHPLPSGSESSLQCFAPHQQQETHMSNDGSLMYTGHNTEGYSSSSFSYFSSVTPELSSPGSSPRAHTPDDLTVSPLAALPCPLVVAASPQQPIETSFWDSSTDAQPVPQPQSFWDSPTSDSTSYNHSYYPSASKTEKCPDVYHDEMQSGMASGQYYSQAQAQAHDWTHLSTVPWPDYRASYQAQYHRQPRNLPGVMQASGFEYGNSMTGSCWAGGESSFPEFAADYLQFA